MNLIFVPGSPCAIDAAELNEHGQCLGLHSGLPLRDLQARHPGAQVGSEDDFIASLAASVTVEPISEQAFRHAREMMPPLSWHSSHQEDGEAETFVFGELEGGTMATIYARLGERYWRLQGVATLPHQAIVSQVRAAQVGMLRAYQGRTSPALYR